MSAYAVSETMSAAGPALANHLWQSTLFVAAAWLLTLALRRNQARMRYGLWLAASVKFLVPFALLVALGSVLAPARPAPVQASVVVAMEQVSQPFAPAEDVVAFAPRAVVAEPVRVLPLLLAGAWVCGAAVVLVRWTRRWFKLRAVLRRAERASEGREVEALRRIGVAEGAMPVLLTETTLGPGICGVVRPVLLWPRAITARLSDEHLEAILAHELAHVRRWDNLTAALHMAVEAVFWFHPLVWFVGVRMMEERERACDEAVLEDVGIRSAEYAEGILRVCEFALEPGLPCVSGVTGSDLKQRIVHIMTAVPAPRLSLGRRVLLSAAAVAALALPMAVGAMDARAGGSQASSAIQSTLPPGKKLSFDVASVRLNELGIPPAGPPPQTNVDLDPGDIYAPTGGILRVKNKSLRTLIAFAYKMNGNQQLYLKEHVPTFVLTDRFDVEARTENTNPTKDEMRLMMRSLLEERFKLAVHLETRQAPVLAMVPARAGKLGPQIRPHKADDPVCAAAPTDQTWQLAADGFPAVCGSITILRPTAGWDHKSQKIGGRNVPMSLIAEALVAPYTGDTGLTRPVIDRTGLTGTFDFTLELEYTEMGPTFSPDTAPLFLEELNDQLGLKLQPQKGPEQIYVVDHVERLSSQDQAEMAAPAEDRHTLDPSTALSQASRHLRTTFGQETFPNASDKLPAFGVASVRQNKSWSKPM